MRSELADRLKVVIPPVIAAREAIGLGSENLDEVFIADALLSEAFMCTTCFAEREKEEPLFDFLEKLVREMTPALSDIELFDWTEVPT
jgi:hypothetical protein